MKHKNMLSTCDRAYFLNAFDIFGVMSVKYVLQTGAKKNERREKREDPLKNIPFICVQLKCLARYDCRILTYISNVK